MSYVRVSKLASKNLVKLKKYGFDDRYVANNKGHVYLIKENKSNYYLCKKMKPFRTKDGYVEYVLTNKDGVKKHVQEQIISAGLYLNKVRGKDYVNHKNGKRDDNYYKNLEYSTVKENINHSFDKLGKQVWNKGKKKQEDGSFK